VVDGDQDVAPCTLATWRASRTSAPNHTDTPGRSMAQLVVQQQADASRGLT
jgi:hypothetical protein